MNNTQQLTQWILPPTLILGGLLLGWVVERFILAHLKRLAAHTRWSVDEFIIGALRGMPVLWFSLIGLNAATLNLPLSAENSRLIQKGLLVVGLLSATLVVARVAVSFVGLYARNMSGAFPATSIFTNLTRILVFLMGILIILESLEISITPALTALGVGGLAVALALQDTLSNLFSGLQIIASHQVRPGDYVRLESGEEGYVADITWRNTTIRALANNTIVVPNAKLASTIVTNYYQPEEEMSVPVQVGVGYGSDLDQVEQVTIEVAREVLREAEGGVAGFEPKVRFHTFADASVNFNVVLRAREFAKQFPLKHEFIKRLHARYRREGIELPSAARPVYLSPEEAQLNIR